jgi:hypothetical protein
MMNVAASVRVNDRAILFDDVGGNVEADVGLIGTAIKGGVHDRARRDPALRPGKPFATRKCDTRRPNARSGNEKRRPWKVRLCDLVTNLRNSLARPV